MGRTLRGPVVVASICLATLLATAAAPIARAPAPPHAPIRWTMSAQALHDSCASALDHATASLARADGRAPGAAPLANILVPVERALGDLQNTTQPFINLEELSPDSALRAAAAECDESVSTFTTRAAADPALYRAAVAASTAHEATNAADKQLVEDYVENGRYAGAALDSSTRARVLDLQNKLNDLQREYNLALSADSSTVLLTPAQVRGLPPQLLGPAEGQPGHEWYRIPVNESTAGAFYASAQDSAARRMFYIAYGNRGGARTLGLLHTALAVRDSIARLVGASSWAAYQLTLKMARTPVRVDSFLTTLDARLLPKARRELAELATIKRDGGDTMPLAPWDVVFEQNRLRSTRYAVSDSVVRRFFPVDRVVAGVLDIYQSVFGVAFAETHRQDVWAPGVREFSVSDAATGAHIGWFYLDLFPRANKYGHFETVSFRTHMRRGGGDVTEPVAGLVGNWIKPTASMPSLLNHDDVVTFFHEFGHVMADLLNQSPYVTTGVVRQDFVEAPSQALEFWAWRPEVIKRISADYETGKPMPDSLLTRLVALQHFDEGLQWTGQIMLGAFDMALHSGSPAVRIDSLWSVLKNKLTPIPWVPGTSPAASFVHEMAGYDAGYYGYLWSRVYAADIFSRFEQGGVLSPAVGAAYRKDVLEPGGTEEPDKLVTRFLGRPVDASAFLKDIGAAPQRDPRR